jgi:hypothetical protein
LLQWPSQPSIRWRHHHFCRRRMDSMVKVRPLLLLAGVRRFEGLYIYCLIYNLVNDIGLLAYFGIGKQRKSV